MPTHQAFIDRFCKASPGPAQGHPLPQPSPRAPASVVSLQAT
jgi:hypothetical protein